MVDGNRVAGAPVIVAIALSSCLRAPEPENCPVLREGDVVLSELRGPQAELDAEGQWIELRGPTPEVVDLRGIRLDVRYSDGVTALRLVVRESVELEGGGFAVLGLMPLQRAPPFVDTSVHADAATLGGSDDDSLIEADEAPHEDLPATAGIELWACETLVDEVRYGPLPQLGTFFASGDDVPHGQEWCASSAEDRFGTPRAPNPACP